MVLSLEEFGGKIVLDGNTFSYNTIRFKTCDGAGVEMQTGNNA